MKPWIGILIGAMLLTAAVAGLCETPEAPVARVSFASGDACYLRGDDPEGGWAVLSPNTPLMAGDSVYAPDGSRIEIDFGNGNVVRLDSATQLDLVDLASQGIQLGLSGGRLDLRIRALPRGFTAEIDTPAAAASITRTGSYRALVRDSVTDFDVLSGGMSVAANGEERPVEAGETLEVTAGQAQGFDVTEVPGPDAFDEWSEARDAPRDVSESARYVDTGVVGYEDLDSAGDWMEDAVYGEVWVPAGVPAGWAPYSNGSWIWQDPYGWTWVAIEPWGWAPFHYGRWAYARGFWAWVPPRGGPGVLVLYAPALVGFIGGPGWSYGVAWVALAPGEPYAYPWQPAPVIGRRYRNVTVFNGVTAVTPGQFGRGRIHAATTDPRLVMKASSLGTVLSAVKPSRESLTPHPERRPPTQAQPPASLTRATLMARRVPPPSPVSFSKKLEEIKVTGKPVARPVPESQASGKPFAPGATAPTGRFDSAYVRHPVAPQPPGRGGSHVNKPAPPGPTVPTGYPPPHPPTRGEPPRGPSVPFPSEVGTAPQRPRPVSSPRVITLPPSPTGGQPPPPSAPPARPKWTPTASPPTSRTETPRTEPGTGATGRETPVQTYTPRETTAPARPMPSDPLRTSPATSPSSGSRAAPTPAPQPRNETPTSAPKPASPSSSSSSGSQTTSTSSSTNSSYSSSPASTPSSSTKPSSSGSK